MALSRADPDMDRVKEGRSSGFGELIKSRQWCEGAFCGICKNAKNEKQDLTW